jgi:hypothetical protein
METSGTEEESFIVLRKKKSSKTKQAIKSV